MRWKIITANSVIVALLGLFLYALLRTQLTDVLSNEARIQSDATRVVSAANAQLQLDALRVERWLDAQTDNPALREPFQASIQNARFDAATEQCNRVQAAAVQAPQLTGSPPAIVALVDANGVSLGRNGSNLMRGDDLGKTHPRLKQVLSRGATGSDIWYRPELSQQWFVSYAAIRSPAGQILGALVYGTPLNDERMTRTTDKTSGGALLIAVPSARGVDAVAKSSAVSPKVVESLVSAPLDAQELDALKADNATRLVNAPASWVIVGLPLGGYGDGHQALLVASAPVAAADLGGLAWSILGMVVLGVVLVSIAGVLLGNYISGPVEQLEEGLLQILNGRTDLRFEIEHAVMGGLVFRINTLLNQLTGVAEDDTDDEGRPSRPPSAQAFRGALEVDEKASAGAESVDVRTAVALAQEPADQYYPRIFREYIEAKRSIGDPVDHITEQSFIERIRQRELEMSNKTGRPVRYQVQLRGKEVVLLAVQLP